jgi:hypothetical protein
MQIKPCFPLIEQNDHFSDGHAGKNIMRGVAWNVGHSRFVKIANMH